MKKLNLYVLGLFLINFSFYSCKDDKGDDNISVEPTMIIDHTCTKIDKIPVDVINKIPDTLFVAFNNIWPNGGIISNGMRYLGTFKGSSYNVDETGRNNSLYFDYRHAFGDVSRIEFDDSAWYMATIDTLKVNKKINVVMWCWDQLISEAKSSDITNYLNFMVKLEKQFPSVKFVYMTGSVDGTSNSDNLYIRNEQIRNFCKENKKILLDIADIESYDPDDIYYGDKMVNDTCGYDSNGDGQIDKNWATEWQIKNPKKWYLCLGNRESAPHVQANQKAYAIWWMLARITGWKETN